MTQQLFHKSILHLIAITGICTFLKIIIDILPQLFHCTHVRNAQCRHYGIYHFISSGKNKMYRHSEHHRLSCQFFISEIVWKRQVQVHCFSRYNAYQSFFKTIDKPSGANGEIRIGGSPPFKGNPILLPRVVYNNDIALLNRPVRNSAVLCRHIALIHCQRQLVPLALLHFHRFYGNTDITVVSQSNILIHVHLTQIAVGNLRLLAAACQQTCQQENGYQTH